MRSWKCRITGYRDRQRVAIGRLETRRFGSLQSETLAISGLTRNDAFGPRGFVLPFQISRLVWPAYYIPPGKLPVCFDDL